MTKKGRILGGLSAVFRLPERLGHPRRYLRPAAGALMACVFAGAVWSATRQGASPEVDTVDWLPGVAGADQLSTWVSETHVPAIVVPPRRIDLIARASRLAVGGSGPTVANRNHNPLNVKFGAVTRPYVDQGRATISDITPLDGGAFLRFEGPSTGFRAAADLLRARPYQGLELDVVFRRWSNNGFGAEILDGTALHGQLTVADLTPDELGIVLGAMATAEGYRSARLAQEIGAALQRSPTTAVPPR